jgi:hypothetical protein
MAESFLLDVANRMLGLHMGGTSRLRASSQRKEILRGQCSAVEVDNQLIVLRRDTIGFHLGGC